MSWSLSRRSWLQAAGLGSLMGARRGGPPRRRAGRRSGTTATCSGTAATRWARSAGRHVALRPRRAICGRGISRTCPEDQRARFYRETPRPDGSLLREYEIFAVDREIEIAPGVMFPAWTYNGQVPGPTIRATEGDRVARALPEPGRASAHDSLPRLASARDGRLAAEHQVLPGETFVYEFDAEPFGLHLYHCHTVPLKRHIHKGLYGTFIVDPNGADRPPRRRARDDDERVRHELRRRERGLRGQHRRQLPTCTTRSG